MRCGPLFIPKIQCLFLALHEFSGRWLEKDYTHDCSNYVLFDKSSESESEVGLKCGFSNYSVLAYVTAKLDRELALRR